jgi:hypothetical protein
VICRIPSDRFGSQGNELRRLLSLAVTTAFLLLITANFAHTQEIDLAATGNTVWSPENKTAAEGFLPPALKGGVFPGATFQYKWNEHEGFNVEGLYRYHDAVYDGFQKFRPMMFDANGVYSWKLPHKITLDAMAGIGIDSLIFYNQFYSCGNGSAGCTTHLNATHFMVDAGFGLRRYFFRNFFVRAEAHYNFIPNNYEFHSDSLFRISVGYTWGRRVAKPAKASQK